MIRCISRIATPFPFASAATITANSAVRARPAPTPGGRRRSSRRPARARRGEPSRGRNRYVLGRGPAEEGLVRRGVLGADRAQGQRLALHHHPKPFLQAVDGKHARPVQRGKYRLPPRPTDRAAAGRRGSRPAAAAGRTHASRKENVCRSIIPDHADRTWMKPAFRPKPSQGAWQLHCAVQHRRGWSRDQITELAPGRSFQRPRSRSSVPCEPRGAHGAVKIPSNA